MATKRPPKATPKPVVAPSYSTAAAHQGLDRRHRSMTGRRIKGNAGKY